MGAAAYGTVELIDDINPDEDCIVEIGSENGDGSTKYLAQKAVSLGIPFISIDFNDKTIENIKNIPGLIAVCDKGEDFLINVFPSLNKKIKFAYLDNFDWIYVPHDPAYWVIEQIDYYKSRGVIMTNVNSQEVHLKQAKEIVKYAADSCIILIDDTWIIEEHVYDGKGGTAVPFLISQGFKIIDSSNAHILLQRK